MNSRPGKLWLPIALILFHACIGVGPSLAQKPLVNAASRQFEHAEELLYETEFSRSLLRGVDIAEFRLSANRMPAMREANSTDSAGMNQRQPYAFLFIGDVHSKGFFTKLFNLNFRQRVESTVDPLSFTVQKTSRIDEQGKRLRTSETTYDKNTGEVVWTELDPNSPTREPRITRSQFTGQVQDILSAIYFLRIQPLTVGNTLALTVSDSGRIYPITVKVVEKKRMKTVLGRVHAVRVDPELFGPKGMLKIEAQISIWLTDDDRHLPVSARIKSEYGTFVVKLKKVIENPAGR